MFAVHFNIGAAQSSLALSFTTGLLAVSILFAGPASENLGRKWLMFGSICGSSALNLIAAIAPDWRLLLIARALEGIALGGVPAVAMAYLSEEIHPGNLGLAMGRYIGGSAFGGMMGRVGTAVLVDLTGWQTALAIISVFGLLAAAGLAFLLPPSRNFTRRTGFEPSFHLRAWFSHLKSRKLFALFSIGFLAMGAFVTVYNYSGFRLLAPPYNLSQTEAGLIFTAYLFGIAASATAGAMADKYGQAPILIAGALLTALGLALTALNSLTAIVPGIALFTIGFFASHSVASGWVGRLAIATKGHAASLYLLSYYLGSSVLGTLGGWFWERRGWTGVLSFTGVLIGLMLALAICLRKMSYSRIAR